MHLFLTSVLPFLAHDHASAAAFLTCRHHNFHASIIPEFLSDEERVKGFAEARQQNQLKADKQKQSTRLYNLFVQTPLMQFSPSLVVRQKDCAESILKPLLATKYFFRTLQRCSFQSPLWSEVEVFLTNALLQGLSKVQSLTKLELDRCKVNNEHMGIIINSFVSLETLTIYDSSRLDPASAISISSPPPPATKTLRSLTMETVDALFATHLAPHFTNLRDLHLSGGHNSSQDLDLLPLSSSLPLLTDLALDTFSLENIESLENLVHLSSVYFNSCSSLDLSFLTQEDSLPELKEFGIDDCDGLSTSSFASLTHAPNLRVLRLISDDSFDNDCLQYLESMVHLRFLDLSRNSIVGDSRSLKPLMQNLIQLEELSLEDCRGIGGQGAIAGALYSTHSRLRVVNLSYCNLVDDDLNGIGALKNTLEVLDLSFNRRLTNEALVHCKDLVKLKVLILHSCDGINKVSPLKDCLNLEDLHVWNCEGLTDDSFKTFSKEPNSFPNLRRLNLSRCYKLTEIVFEHLSKNKHLVYQLKELGVNGMFGILSSSETARNNLCQLRGLSRLHGVLSQTLWGGATCEEIEVTRELMKSLRNLDAIE